MPDLKENLAAPKVSTSVVSSVLEAAAFVLPSTGYVKSTTNLIAEKAGVSIGSLYYYFRNKDAVYKKLADKILGSYIERLERRLGNLSMNESASEALISEVVDFTFENRQLLRTLFSMSAKLRLTEAVYNLRNSFAQNLAVRMGHAPKDVYVLVNAVNGVMDNYIYSTSCPLNQEEMKSSLLRLVGREDPINRHID